MSHIVGTGVANGSPGESVGSYYGDGVYESKDGGHSWAAANAGLQPQCPWSYALALDPRTSQVVYAADQALRARARAV